MYRACSLCADREQSHTHTNPHRDTCASEVKSSTRDAFERNRKSVFPTSLVYPIRAASSILLKDVQTSAVAQPNPSRSRGRQSP